MLVHSGLENRESPCWQRKISPIPALPRGEWLANVMTSARGHQKAIRDEQ